MSKRSLESHDGAPRICESSTPNARRRIEISVTLIRLIRPGVLFVSEALAALRLGLIEAASKRVDWPESSAGKNQAAMAKAKMGLRRLRTVNSIRRAIPMIVRSERDNLPIF